MTALSHFLHHADLSAGGRSQRASGCGTVRQRACDLPTCMIFKWEVSKAAPGDIATVGHAADTTGGKSLAFVLLADLSGQTINFTDNGWLAVGGFRSGEGTVSYTLPASTPIGTVVTITGLTGALNPSTGGDSIIDYIGTAASPTLLFAIDFADGNTNTSALPTGLTLGSIALAFAEDNGAKAGGYRARARRSWPISPIWPTGR